MKKFIVYFASILPLVASSQISIQNSYMEALDYEAKVQSSIYQTQAKKEEISQATSRLYPKIDLQMNATKREYKVNYGGDNREENYYTATLGFQIPIYNPENYNLIDQSRLKYKFTALYSTQLKQELALNVTDAFMLIIRAKNSLSVADAYLEANEIRYKQIKNMYEKRLANKMDFLESKVTYEQSKIKVSSEKQNLSLAKYKFKNLTGIEDITIPKIDLENIDISKLDIIYNKNDLLDANLEIQKSKINIDLKQKDIEFSSYGHYPKVDLSASYSKYDTDSIYTDYTNDSKVSLNFKIPLYQGGYVESRIGQSRYLLSAANEDLKDMQRKTIADYEELAIQLQTSKENIELYKQAIESSKLYLHAVNKGYESGLKNLIDVEDAKTKLFESKFKLIDSVYQYIKSYASLLNTFGLFSEEKLIQLDEALF